MILNITCLSSAITIVVQYIGKICEDASELCVSLPETLFLAKDEQPYLFCVFPFTRISSTKKDGSMSAYWTNMFVSFCKWTLHMSMKRPRRAIYQKAGC